MMKAEYLQSLHNEDWGSGGGDLVPRAQVEEERMEVEEEEVQMLSLRERSAWEWSPDGSQNVGSTYWVIQRRGHVCQQCHKAWHSYDGRGPGFHNRHESGALPG